MHGRNKAKTAFFQKLANSAGTFRRTALLAAFGFVSTPAALAAPGDLLLTLRPPELEAFTGFGDSLGVVGGNIIVGAPDTHLLDDGLTFVGQAHVFSGATGELLFTIPHPESEDRADFGNAVLGFNEQIWIGAPGQNIPGNSINGAVYVFDSSDGAFLHSIRNPVTSGLGRRFGDSLAAAGDKVLTSQPARFLPSGRFPIGSVNLIDPISGAADFEIINPALADGETDAFSAGNGIASLGGKPVVGAIQADITDENDQGGRVYVFDDVTGDLLLTIDNPEPTSGNLTFIPDWFGFAVAATDDKIFVGARLDDPQGVQDAGIVYAFDGTTGELLLTIEPPDLWPLGEFGRSIAAVGDNILVGAYRTPVNGVERAGKAYLFDGDTGQLLLELANPEPGPDFFGWQVAPFGNDILVSAFNDGPLGEGTVYLFEGVPEPSTLSLMIVTIVAWGAVCRALQTRRGRHRYRSSGEKERGVNGWIEGSKRWFEHSTVATATLWRILAVTTAGFLVASPVLAAPGDLLLTLRPPGLEPFTGFGDSLGVVGGNIIVGAPDKHLLDDGLTFVGQAHVFNGATGELLYTIPHPEPGNGADFGNAVLGFGNQIFVGAPGQDVPGNRENGAVYVFDSSNGAFSHVIRNPVMSGIGNRFGDSLAAAGDKVLTSQPARFLPSGQGPVGSVNLIDPISGAADFEIINPALDDGVGDAFSSGNGIASLGSKLVVGATHADVTDENDSAGRVYVFDDVTGDLLLTIENPEPTSANFTFLADWFGFAVAATDEKVFVGARVDDPQGVEDAGIVYAFDGTTGELLLTIEPPDLWPDGEFGKSIAAVGNDILVGAYDTPVNGVEHAGKAYLFDGDTGQLLLELANPEPGPDFFGWQVAPLGNDILVSAFNDGPLGEGTVYLFEGVPEPGTLFLAISAWLFFYVIRPRTPH